MRLGLSKYESINSDSEHPQQLHIFYCFQLCCPGAPRALFYMTHVFFQLHHYILRNNVKILHALKLGTILNYSSRSLGITVVQAPVPKVTGGSHA